ncbi:MAG: hypothetical protein LAP87_21785 [Acidobacteriia bacterium]|nr:hypothetical protein [Terriglobia bacterium]
MNVTKKGTWLAAVMSSAPLVAFAAVAVPGLAQDPSSAGPPPAGAIIEVKDTPVVLSPAQLGASFEVELNGPAGFKVGDEAYPHRVRGIGLFRHQPEDFKPDKKQDFLLSAAINAMFGMPAVTAVRTSPQNKIEFYSGAPVVDQTGRQRPYQSPTTANFVDTGAAMHGSTSSTGRFPVLYGIFSFEREYALWAMKSKTGECAVELKSAVFETQENALYFGEATGIRSPQCWFAIGEYEFTGEAALSRTGVTLTPGARYRKR